jgi:predicted DCC family thiol-disulfide oxidoreductase YuxK
MGILFDINENSLNLTTRISCAREKFHILETSFLSFFASSFFPTCHAKRFTSSRVQMDHRNASGRSKNTTMMRFAEERYHLVYDADCTLCSRFKRVVDFLDKHEKLDYVSLREAEACGLLDSIPNGRRHSSFHLVSPKGKVTSGSQAIPELVRLLPSGTIVSFLISHFPKAERILNFLYSTISRLHDSGNCSYDPHKHYSKSHGFRQKISLFGQRENALSSS